MLGLDTNVLVRFLTRDHAAQARRARQAMEEALEAGERLHVDVVVLCELVWVLRSAYGLPKERIGHALEVLLATREFVVQDADLVRRALLDYLEGKGDFTDALIGHRNRRSGCSTTLTFDKRLRRHGLFRRL